MYLKIKELIENNMRSGNFIVCLMILALLTNFEVKECQAQINAASTANWLYPDGNSEGTRYVLTRSDEQEPDSFKIKWSSPSISGDVKPLIGNIINNPKYSPDFRWSPNEIIAVMGNNLVMLDASGTTLKKSALPPYVKNVSVLFDTLSPIINQLLPNPVVMGLETIEVENLKDSLAFAYIAGYNQKADTIALLKRLAFDLRPFNPNLFASIKPVLSRKNGNDYFVYAAVNMTLPKITDTNSTNPQYMRGLALFNTGNVLSTFPIPDIGDDENSRVAIAPEMIFSQPSFRYVSGKGNLLFPIYPSDKLDIGIANNITGITYANKPYLASVNLDNASILTDITPRDLSGMINAKNSRPQIKPYYINSTDAGGSDSIFILVAEEYKGIDGSVGTSRLHLFKPDGTGITAENDTLAPPFTGGANHFWSVAVGNVDGNISNSLLPYYPNHPGNEIIITQSTRDFAYPGSKLFILRYKSGAKTPKPSPPKSNLFAFDTISSQRINGWVAAVNDIDGAPDGKDEIILVDGSNLMILRMRDYNDYEFKIGKPFDTLYYHTFKNETISSVAVADLEGDALNDIIVTTFDSTYAIGINLINVIKLLSPRLQNVPPEEVCVGDSVELVWRNIITGQKNIDILFQEFDGLTPLDKPLMLLKSNIDNERDTVRYFITVDSNIAGKTGRFIIRSTTNANVIDFSAILTFATPNIVLNTPLVSDFWIAEEVEFRGNSSCSDSFRLQYSTDRINWLELDSRLNFNNAGTYSLMAEIPCMDYFNCSGQDKDSIAQFRVIGEKFGYSDTSLPISVLIRPARFPVFWETNTTACPSVKLHWDMKGLKYSCDSVSISVSGDGGRSFSYLATVKASEGGYLWNVPLGLPDTVVVRFCCDNPCVRRDKQVWGYKPEYISIVAPNPFRPPVETLEIVYKVPSDCDVSIRIFDAANRLVAEPVKNIHRAAGIAYCDRWNGEISSGAYAANGIYYLQLEMSNGIREVYHVFVRK